MLSSIIKKLKNTIIKDNEYIGDPVVLPLESQNPLETAKKCDSLLNTSIPIKTTVLAGEKITADYLEGKSIKAQEATITKIDKEDPTLKLQKKLQIIGRKTKKFRIRKKIAKRLANLYGDY